MADLPGPVELLDLAPGASLTFTAVSSEEGETLIHPSYAPAGKTIPVLRVHVDPATKQTFPHYFDISSLTLQAQLRPLVSPGAQLPRRFTVTKVGTGPSARFTLAVAPAEGAPTT